MDRVTAGIIAVVALIIVIAGSIWYYFGLLALVRLILFTGFFGLAALSAIFSAVLIYARSKYLIPALISLVFSAYAAYQCYAWQHPYHVAVIAIGYILVFLAGLWWISEPDLSLYERLRGAHSLEKAGRFRAAARKYEKKADYTRAAECYLKAGLAESAAWCYEKAEKYEKAGEIYERLAVEKGDSYYWKEAYEMYRKAGENLKAAKCLERYAEDEPWFWEDVARIYEENGDEENARRAWMRALEYYRKEAEEDGVFWEDVAKIYEKMGDVERARDAMTKFAEYCENEAKNDPAWWKHVAEAYEHLGEKEKAENAMKRYSEYRSKTEG
ncbi:tetratricopeptide repeat protein [Archaeoglobus neptunius]|uniref:tetratricopeptide repeat protein n=1 Tax=Archaeoglobus neptunius TaxID=2798580 RepID=UPI0019295EB1|nr:tetratricopeptide repeat protein [Archaeoglobus neptunius]